MCWIICWEGKKEIGMSEEGRRGSEEEWREGGREINKKKRSRREKEENEKEQKRGRKLTSVQIIFVIVTYTAQKYQNDMLNIEHIT